MTGPYRVRSVSSAPPPASGASTGDDSSTSPRPRPRVVAVTGVAGFLGSRLISALEQDPRVGRVVAIDVASAPTAGEKTRPYRVDLTEPTAESHLAEILGGERVDTVAHLAFLTSPTHATAWAHELESVGTMHVTVAVRQAQVRKIVLASQTWLYGAHPSNPNFLTEKHPLRAPATEPYFADKIEAENRVRRLAHRSTGTVATILRMAPILGAHVRNAFTRYLARKVVPTMMGFDPLLQFLHESDAVTALHAAITRDAPGIFNIVADGVLPLSTVVHLAGRMAMPIPHPVAEALAAAGWAAQLGDAPPSFLQYLRFLCVADGQRARGPLAFRPTRSSREALLDFVSAQQLRDAGTLAEVGT